MLLKKASYLIFICFLSLSIQAENKTILILGQSGMGKTTTVNAIYNASIHHNTPLDPINSLNFIIPINKGKKNQIPFTGQPSLTPLKNVKTYGGINTGLYTKAGSSDTRDITGYRFTPNFIGWKKNDTLEIVDTPGIDDTASTSFDNNSTHLQIIRKIEEYLREYGEQTHAIFIVVSNSTCRAAANQQDSIGVTFSALRDMLPPEIHERIFIIVNHLSAEQNISKKIKAIIRNKLSWNKKPITIPMENYIGLDLRYIAQFNKETEYKESRQKNYKTQREYTEKNIISVLKKISEFNTPIPLQGYPNYLKYKHDIAQNINHAVDIQFNIDAMRTKCELLQNKFTEAKDIYNYASGQTQTTTENFIDAQSREASTPVDWILDTPKIFDDLFLYFSYQGNEDPILHMQAKEAQHALQETQNKLTELNNRYTTSVEQAQESLNALQNSEYYNQTESSSRDFIQNMQGRIKMHFPELFHDYYQHKQVETYIKNICASLNHETL